MSEFDEKRNEMAEFEARLRAELGRVDAPAGFADRVMGRVERKPMRMARQRWVMFAAAALLLVSVGVGGEHVRQERRREEAEAQFQTAARVTDRALEQAQRQLRAAGLDLSLVNGQ